MRRTIPGTRAVFVGSHIVSMTDADARDLLKRIVKGGARKPTGAEKG